MVERFETTVVACLVALGILLMGYSIAHSHDWYSQEKQDAGAPSPGSGCCGGYDCARISGDKVLLRRTAGGQLGWYFMLDPGDHPMVTKGPVQVFVPDERLRPNTTWDICLNGQHQVLCAWGPKGGS